MPHNAGVTLDLFTGEASYEPPTRQPLCHVASDTSQFRRAVRAHDPLVRNLPPPPPPPPPCNEA